jgi:hypothetical protein
VKTLIAANEFVETEVCELMHVAGYNGQDSVAGALFGALAHLLGALAAFFAGHASAVTGGSKRSFA